MLPSTSTHHRTVSAPGDAMAECSLCSAGTYQEGHGQTACSLCNASIARAAAPLPRKLADTTIPPRPHHHHDHAVALLGRSTPMEGVDAAHPGSVPLTAHDGASVGSRASVSPALSMRRSTGSFSSEFSSVTDECSDASSHLVLEVDGCAIGGVEVTCMLRGRRVCNPLLQPSSC